MKKPKVCVLRTAGTNCDAETAFAFRKVKASPELQHINRVIEGKVSLSDYQILALPGGFTYGDDIAAGKILANELRYKLGDELKSFLEEGKLIIGICNGFQILVKSGLLPGNRDLKQEASLIINDSGKFEDRWTYLRVSSMGNRASGCIWTKGLPDIIYLPVAHGEGKFLTKDKEVLGRMKRNKQVIFQYCDHRGRLSKYPYNPNGSLESIAGICDQSGRIFGLMPHPERHIYFEHHPRWNSLKHKQAGDGLQIFKNGVEYARKHL
ncbi:MAG: phosphoribosylformylglycinamidine synthase I [Candidatus Omnitrophota bacterium]